ncbi:MarR family winged helix-turn-helix transcriptional regulator [Solicola gregarius]|uniref:MarR family transcriptional regulator n=1 Tax=Solicola gregarius TaxID=2908642 RepID=A0AA46TGR5_9ACTN|nr:MarR family transcriptional regulator [Solicola gregarius]UYM05026.1 MarR family transcriptional regulator [Solicola gregarius]
MSDTSWLNDEESRAWRSYNRMRGLLDLEIARDLAADSGLSGSDYTVLVVLSEAPNQRVRQIDLAARMLWSHSRVSHHLGRMERRGLVRRETHADNARAVDAVLTPAGLDAIESAAPCHVRSVRRHFIDQLTAEQVTVLADIADTVVDHLTVAADGEQS